MGKLADFSKQAIEAAKGLLPQAARDFGPEVALAAQEQQMFDLKAQLLAEVREEAAAKGQRPTLEQYRLKCQAFAQTEEGKALAAPDALNPHGRWNEQVQADLSKQNLSGFVFSEPKKIADLANQTPQVQGDFDSFDRDGNGKIDSKPISKFYDNFKCKGSDCRDSIIDPATSFNEQFKSAANKDGMTFNDMRDGDKFVFDGTFTNVHMTNINGGTLTFAKNSRVDFVELKGKGAHCEFLENSCVSHIKTEPGFSIITVKMKPGAMITDSDLSCATFSMTSELYGGEFRNVNFSENLVDVDLRGVKLKNPRINGIPAKHEDFAKFHAQVDETTTIEISPDVQREYALAKLRSVGVGELGKTLASAEQAVTDIKKGVVTPEPQVAALRPEQTMVAGMDLPPTRLAVEHIPDFNALTASLAGTNAAKDLTRTTTEGMTPGMSPSA